MTVDQVVIRKQESVRPQLANMLTMMIITF